MNPFANYVNLFVGRDTRSCRLTGIMLLCCSLRDPSTRWAETSVTFHDLLAAKASDYLQ
jgi:hypothetical protein